MESTDIEAALSRFEQRLKQVEASRSGQSTTLPAGPKDEDLSNGSRWTLVAERSWHPCPFGMLPGGILPSLDIQ